MPFANPCTNPSVPLSPGPSPINSYISADHTCHHAFRVVYGRPAHPTFILNDVPSYHSVSYSVITYNTRSPPIHPLPRVVKPTANPCPNRSVIYPRYPPVHHPSISVQPLSSHSTILTERYTGRPPIQHPFPLIHLSTTPSTTL
ncbi:hypothetical protein T01_12737 [Trichinella spiralis]|uniref:Uncharacterized protein n=1 Tax=Trichinella spiralis TaxID=6334 RepID=A0A0V1ALE1_TRISP|nr:hypothetical protein T01_12737 [Trichinella spiralis]